MSWRCLLGLVVIGLLLVACDSTPPTVAETSTQPHPTLIVTSAAPLVTTINSPTLTKPASNLNPPALLTTATAPNEIITNIAPTIIGGANLLAEAAQKFNQAKSYSFEVSQTATLQAGASTSALSAQGSGLFATGNFSQTLIIKAGGTSQPVEIFIQGDKTYQKLSNLAVWRKLDDDLYKFAATEPSSVLQAAITAKTLTAQGQEKIGTVLSSKYSYIITGEQFVARPGGLGPLPLGLLSATTILNGLAGSDLKASQIQETLWLDSATNLLLQRQWQLATSPTQPNRLLYQATYLYHDFNQPNLNVPVPINLP